MKTCKTCAYWGRPDPYNEDTDLCIPVDPDTYEPMNRGFEVRICDHPTKTFCEPPVEINGFGLADGSTYRAVLATAEQFGCVRHSEYEDKAVSNNVQPLR